MMPTERLRVLNSRETKSGDYVLYWMQAAQRAEANPALQHAVRLANEQRRPCLAFFGLTERFPEANARHLAFMLEGLRETQRALADRGVRLVVRRVQPDRGVVELGRAASLVVTDRGYLRVQKSWREKAAAALACPLIQVETETVVPVETASPKEEYSAATFRPKIRKILASSLAVPADRKPLRDSLGWKGDSLDLENIEDVLAGLKISTGASARRPSTAGRDGGGQEALPPFPPGTARSFRRSPQQSDRRFSFPPQPLSPFRTDFARLGGGESGRVEKPRPGGLSRGAGRPAGAGRKFRSLQRPLRLVRVAAGLGPDDPGPARGRSAAGALHPGRAGGRENA